MKAKVVAQRVGAGFRDRVDKLGNVSQACKLIGRSASFFNAQLKNGGAKLSYNDALLSLERMGDPMPEEVLYTAISQLDTDPALILLVARENQKMLAPDLYFREVRPRLEALIAAGPTPEGDWYSRAEKIARLDTLRRRDRDAAKLKLQELISNALNRLEQSGQRSPRAFADLASTLVVLAALQRLAGRRDDAMDLLLTSRKLGLLGRDLKVRGEWYQGTAYLLVDLGREVRAYQFLQEANRLYFLAGLPAKQAEVMVDTAYVLTHAGQYAESKEILELVLPILPESLITHRSAAHQILADNLQELGDLAGARKQLDCAIELARDDVFARAYCLWSRARLLAVLDDVPPALASYQEALPLYARLTGAGELAELAMEYAVLLAKEGRRPELRALAADLAGWIQQLKGNQKLRAVIDNFVALVEFNKFTADSAIAVVEAIAESKTYAIPGHRGSKRQAVQ